MTTSDRIFGQPSARVVALARLGLAAVFFIGTLADHPEGTSPVIIPVLTGFLCFSMIIAVVTWKDWWLDARIALACHIMDVAFFVAVVGAPQGYSSPYFLYFVFLLLSPAIRWTWRETAVTATIVIMLYVVAGLLFGLASPVPFDSRRFIIRSGYLMILSIVLIWFGVRRRFSVGSVGEPMAAAAIPNDTPLAAALRRGLAATGATEALAYWAHRDGNLEAVALSGDELRPAATLEMPASRPNQAFLFDAGLDRALVNGAAGRARFTSIGALVGERVRGALDSGQGLAIPVDSDLGRGLFLFSNIENLHSDHLPLGDRLRSELASVMERYALFSALRDGAIARERLALARDLHDGVIQFLAGSAYQIEAISRSSATGSASASDLQELKQLMLMEQEDLRSSIGTLRRDKIDTDDTEAAAEALCERLSRQWHVECAFTCDVPCPRIPARVHMDLLNIIKECVANAVRHASAPAVHIRLTGPDRELRLTARNAVRPGDPPLTAAPWSIRERVAESGGSVTVTSDSGETVVTVILPMPEDSE